jgi:hypothetical protein
MSANLNGAGAEMNAVHTPAPPDLRALIVAELARALAAKWRKNDEGVVAPSGASVSPC